MLWYLPQTFKRIETKVLFGPFITKLALHLYISASSRAQLEITIHGSRSVGIQRLQFGWLIDIVCVMSSKFLLQYTLGDIGLSIQRHLRTAILPELILYTRLSATTTIEGSIYIE